MTFRLWRCFLISCLLELCDFCELSQKCEEPSLAEIIIHTRIWASPDKWGWVDVPDKRGLSGSFARKGLDPIQWRGRYFQTFWAPDPNKWPSPVPQTSSVLHWNINSLEVWGPSGPQLRVGDPSGLFTSSFVPFGRSGRVTYADGDLWRYRLRIFVTECSGRDCGSWIHRQIMMTKYNLITSQRQLSISGICVWPPSLPLSWRSFSS